MFPRIAPLMRLTVVYLGLAVGLAGCNVDWMWPDRQAPGGHRAAVRPEVVKIPSEPIDISIVDAQEVDLVEEVMAHRVSYHQSLERLARYYQVRGYATKQQWADFELDGLKSVKAFRYLLDAEVPGASLRPEEQIAEADTLYERGAELMRRGGHGTPALYRRDLMIQAAQVLRELIEKHPTSDKIDDAAFLLGEIHKEYLSGQETIAVKWYERAWTWDPATPYPARFQAAVVYDYRLHDRDRALELYHEVVSRETHIGSNVRFANRRIHELTRGNGVKVTG